MTSTCFGGLEIGGSTVRCVIGTDPRDIRADASFPTTGPDETLARAIAFFRAHAPVLVLGIASFGPLDLEATSPSAGFITETPKPGWSRVDVGGALRRALQVPVTLDTDVNGAALAEWRWGAGTGCDPIVYVTVGTGIGGGAIIDGRRLHGAMHPEMGHMRVPRHPDDPFSGACPFHGDCLEGLASGAAIRVRRGLPGEALTVDDPVWALEARYLALGLANIVVMLAPRRVIVGGGVMRQSSLLARVREEMRALLAGYVRMPEGLLVPPALGERAGVLGALALARERA
jgi:fructokinase